MIESKSSTPMVYTPAYHIPIGVLTITETGEYALTIKKSKGRETETITLGMLVSMMYDTAARYNNAATP